MKKRISNKREKMALQYLNSHPNLIEMLYATAFRFNNPLPPIKSYTRKPILLKTRFSYSQEPPAEILYRDFARSLCMNKLFRQSVHTVKTEQHAYSMADIYGTTEYVMSIKILPN